MKKIVTLCMSLLLMFSLAGCNDAATNDNIKTREAGNRLQEQQSTPTDLDFSLERYNLIRRAYWVNGQREKAAGSSARWRSLSATLCSLPRVEELWTARSAV